jgi:hypothetical protein
VRAFAVTLYTWFTRIKNLVSEFATGFGEAISSNEASFTMLGGALTRLGQAFGFITETPAEAGQAFNQFGEAGLGAGRTIGNALARIADYLTVVIDFWGGFKKKLDLGAVWPIVVSAFSGISEAITTVMTALGGLTSAFGGSGSAASTLGGLLATSLLATIRTVGNVVQWLATIVANAGQVLGGALNLVIGLLTGNWARAWLGAKQIVFGVVSAIVDTFGSLVQFVASGIDTLSSLAGSDTHYAADIGKWRTDVRDGMAASMGVDAAGVAAATAPPVVQTANPLSLPYDLPASMPYASGVGPSASADTALMSKAVDAIASASAKSPAVVNVYVGDELLTSYVTAKGDENDARNFTPSSPDA